MSNRLPVVVIFFIVSCFSSARVVAQKDKEEKPVEYYEKLVEDSENALEFHNQAYRHFVRKEYTKALVLYDKALALDTTNSHYFSNRGHAHKALQHWEKALADYKKANEIDPHITHETYVQSAEIYQKQFEDYETAASYYTLSIERLEDNKLPHLLYISYFNRANCYLKLKDYSKAIADYTKTIELNKEHYGSYLNRGLARYQSDDKSGACTDWHKAKSLGYSGASRYINRYCK